MNSSSLTHGDDKFTILRDFLSAVYVVGIVGSVLALLHLFKKQKLRNNKQVFMLK